MEPTAADVERIPRENLRVPRDEFVAVWTLAERLAHGDWYAVGVLRTCRWIACSFPPSLPALGGRPEPARAPLSRTQAQAHPELIEAEAATVDRWVARNPSGIEGREGWLEAIAATMEWVWRGSGRPPLDISQASAG